MRYPIKKGSRDQAGIELNARANQIRVKVSAF